MALNIGENVPLAPLTTLGVGGPARYLAEVHDLDRLRGALAFAREHDVPVFVLGGGSNLVVSDAGFNGVVLKIAIRGITATTDGDATVFEVGAGEDWDTFVAVAVRRGCTGVECLSGIPGLVGGTPVQNVGAYGQEVSQTISAVEAVEIVSGESRTFTNAQCAFGYRISVFNTSARGECIITRVTFALRTDATPSLHYADLKNHFAARATPPTLDEVREAVIAIRRRKGMVLDESDPDSRSAGSFFKNPVLSEAEHAALLANAGARGLTVPSYPALEARHKISAAWLVENAGFHRGYVYGRVGISSKHSLALVNRGGASAADVIALKDAIEGAVREQFGVQLRPEPVFLGFPAPH